MSSSVSLRGWLSKQRHGLRKSWQRRYFVLEGNILYYYKSETDTTPTNKLLLDNYDIVTDVIPMSIPAILKKQPSHQHTFLLMAKDGAERSDMFLQAETREELETWVTALQQPPETTSVLDKWLERLDDMHPQNNTSSSKNSEHTSSISSGSAKSTSAVAMRGAEGMKEHLSPTTRPPLRGHRSSESIASSICSGSTMATSQRSSFTELRRTSNPTTPSTQNSTNGGKFLTNLFQHWPRKSSSQQHEVSQVSSSPALLTQPPSSPPASMTGAHTSTGTAIPTTTTAAAIAPVLPILHPDEYNKEYDPVDPRQRSVSSSLTTRRNIQVVPIGVDTRRLSRGHSCSEIAHSDSLCPSSPPNMPDTTTTTITNVTASATDTNATTTTTTTTPNNTTTTTTTTQSIPHQHYHQQYHSITSAAAARLTRVATTPTLNAFE
ncbi:hypothetical protein BCR43DRAFT_493223 [Syncephalastrum racemosum]|uniref:PH domain-containing protein n=1 Tax=Syncephalastrum racemosum TaxID=13706 RepID=A0A1X2HA87_SYNRA|nr:hypothetical protein BCR43DRAFT_493223 [Syncephalastrum racemosum]